MYHQNTLKIFSPQYLRMFAVVAGITDGRHVVLNNETTHTLNFNLNAMKPPVFEGNQVVLQEL